MRFNISNFKYYSYLHILTYHIHTLPNRYLQSQWRSSVSKIFTAKPRQISTHIMALSKLLQNPPECHGSALYKYSAGAKCSGFAGLWTCHGHYSLCLFVEYVDHCDQLSSSRPVQQSRRLNIEFTKCIVDLSTMDALHHKLFQSH
jgi:hypothetical protein